MKRYIVYTDGSCSYKSKEGGWAFVSFNNHKIIHSENGAAEDTTVSRCEMIAMRNALMYLNTLSKIGSGYVRTDSQYVKKGILEWRHGWEMRNYYTFEGKEVKNQDLWKQIYAEVDKAKFPLKIQWVKGHSGIYGNEEADRLATLGRKKIRILHVKRSR